MPCWSIILCLITGSSPHQPIPVASLADHVERNHLNENCGFSEEYKVCVYIGCMAALNASRINLIMVLIIYYRSFKSGLPSTLWMPAQLLTTNQGIDMPTYSAVSHSISGIKKSWSYVSVADHCFRWPQPCYSDSHWRIWTRLYQWKFHRCKDIDTLTTC